MPTNMWSNEVGLLMLTLKSCGKELINLNQWACFPVGSYRPSSECINQLLIDIQKQVYSCFHVVDLSENKNTDIHNQNV